MKVICIDDKCHDILLGGKKLQITEGEIYTASNTPRPDVYFIHEVPLYDGEKVYYEKFRFIPLSNIDETQLLNKEREVYETER